MEHDFVTLAEFEEIKKLETKKYLSPIKLKDYKFDGRKYIQLHCRNNQSLRIKFGLAKKIWPNLPVIESWNEFLEVDAYFREDSLNKISTIEGENDFINQMRNVIEP